MNGKLLVANESWVARTEKVVCSLVSANVDYANYNQTKD